jgi:TatD DNase family protein
MNLVDSHAHVHFPRFDKDRKAVIERARKAGLTAIVEIGTNLASSRAAVALAEGLEEGRDFVYAAVGVHPHDAKTLTPVVLDEIRSLARHPQVVAIGEIGLDYYRNHSPRPTQRRAFARQLELATELSLPVIVHSRDSADQDRRAHNDVLAALRDWEGSGVIHSYSAGVGGLDDVLDLGFFVGISGPVTFPKANELRMVAARAPLDRLLVETDCPYLTPKPYRGRRNEPAYVQYVVEAIAIARDATPKAVAEATTQNARRLFGWR